MTNKEKHNQYVKFVTETLLALFSGEVKEATKEENAIYKMTETGKLNKDAMLYFAKKKMKEERDWEIDKDYYIGDVNVKKGTLRIIPIRSMEDILLDFKLESK